MDALQRDRARLITAARARLGRARSRELPGELSARVRDEIERAVAGVRPAAWIGGVEDARSLVDARTWFKAAVRECAKRVDDAELEDRAAAEFDLALAHDRYGDVCVVAGELEVAYGEFEVAAGLFRALAQEAPRSELIGNRLLRAYDKVAHCAMCVDRLEDARGWLEHALDLLHAAASASPRMRTQYALLQVFLELGSVATLTARAAEAGGWFDSAIDVARAMLAREPAHAWWQHYLCVALVSRAGAGGTGTWLAEARTIFADSGDARDVILAEERASLAARMEEIGS